MESKKLVVVVIILLVIILLGIGGLGFVIYKSQHVNPSKEDQHAEDSGPKIVKDLTKPPILYSTPDIVCMLQSPLGTGHILALNVHLDLKQEKDKDIMKVYQPVILDIIHDTVGRYTLDEVKGPQGQVRLKNDLIKKLNQYFKTRGIDYDPVYDLYYNQYLTTEQ